MSKIHKLKIWPEFFSLLMSGDKLFEVRKNDRDYQPGDFIKFYEWKRPVYDSEGSLLSPGDYTGDRSPYYKVNYILYEMIGIEKGYVVLGLYGPWGKPV